MNQINETDIYYQRWKKLPWKKFSYRKTYLQTQIYNSRKSKNFEKLYKNQIILLRSKACHYIAIQETNSLYFKSYGISMSYSQRFDLVAALEQKNTLYILCKNKSSKKSNEDCSLIENSIKEFLWKLAMEPAYKATLSNHFLFRYGQVIENYTDKQVLTNFIDRSIKLIYINWKKLLISTRYSFLLRRVDVSNFHKVILHKLLKKGLFDLIEGLELEHSGKHPLVFFLLSITFIQLESIFLPLASVFHKNHAIYVISVSTDINYVRKQIKDLFFQTGSVGISDQIFFSERDSLHTSNFV
jgi:hypothetical protein